MSGTTLELSDADLELLLAALDSHRYWELADPVYGGGEGDVEGSEAARALGALDELERRLLAARDPGA